MQKLFRSNAIAVTIWRLLSKCIIIVTFEWNFVIIFPVNPLPLCHLSADVDYQFRRHSSGHFTTEREKQSSLISPPSIKIRFCLSFYTWSSPFHPFHPFVSNWMMLQNFSPCVNAHPCLHSSCLSLLSILYSRLSLQNSSSSYCRHLTSEQTHNYLPSYSYLPRIWRHMANKQTNRLFGAVTQRKFISHSSWWNNKFASLILLLCWDLFAVSSLSTECLNISLLLCSLALLLWSSAVFGLQFSGQDECDHKIATKPEKMKISFF